MTADVKKTVAASIVIALSAGFLFLTLGGLPPSVNRKPHQGLGQVLGEEAVKLLGSGGRITVIGRDTEAFPNPSADAQLKSFQRAVAKAGAKVAVTKLLRSKPLSVVTVPPGEFFDILKKQSDADVIVSFMGPAVLDDAQLAKLGEKRPKVLALCTGTLPRRVPLQRLFDQKLLHAAVLSREQLLSGSPASDTPRGWFDHWFQLVTPASVAETPLPDARP